MLEANGFPLVQGQAKGSTARQLCLGDIPRRVPHVHGIIFINYVQCVDALLMFFLFSAKQTLRFLPDYPTFTVTLFMR